jgi:hypothetical protein
VIVADAGGIEMEDRGGLRQLPEIYPGASAAGRHRGTGGSGVARRGRALTAPQRLAVEGADTLFIASVHEGTGADASHRGGQPGFVRVLDERTLQIPDYSGNNMFQTARLYRGRPARGTALRGLRTGTTLQLTAEARLLWDRPDFAELKGAERAVEIQIGRDRGDGRATDHSAGASANTPPFNPRLER